MIEFSIKKSLVSAADEIHLDITAELETGSFTALYGKSGSGKTSILRMLAGLLTPDSGEITANSRCWFNSINKTNLTPQRRNIGFVFQDYALFPNMTVAGNLQYASRGGTDKKMISDLIEIMELGDLRNKKPAMLSGGQQQRLAIARSLVSKPRLLLLDEPFTALDNELRSKLQEYVIQIHREHNFTTLMVSHDVGEIIKMSNRVLQIDHGQIIKEGTPIKMFSNDDLSGKFKLSGEIIEISKQDVVYMLLVLIGKDLIKVVVEEAEISGLKVGDQVLVASKAFNPIIIVKDG